MRGSCPPDASVAAGWANARFGEMSLERSSSAGEACHFAIAADRPGPSWSSVHRERGPVPVRSAEALFRGTAAPNGPRKQDVAPLGERTSEVEGPVSGPVNRQPVESRATLRNRLALVDLMFRVHLH